jgi:hypothetical protein
MLQIIKSLFGKKKNLKSPSSSVHKGIGEVEKEIQKRKSEN